MRIFTPKTLLFMLSSLLLVAGLYYPALNGGPLFDDYHFIFNYQPFIENYSYSTIFNNFAWPVSNAIHKILYDLWYREYLNSHLLNLALHFLNSYLFLKLLKKLNLPYANVIFLLFLIHPANVISVAWMVQLKTLLCFTFCITAFLFLIKSMDDKRYYPLSWLSFLLSVLSKSASLPLGVIFLAYGFKKQTKAQLIWMLPFFIISTHSFLKTVYSPVTSEGVTQLKSKTYVAEEYSKKKEIAVVQAAPQIKAPEASSELIKRLNLFLKTSQFYFWQVIMPFESIPIRGQNPKQNSIIEIFQLVFLVTIVFIAWGNLTAIYLIAGYLMITPFLGIVAAPFMNVTWVSEQHLYLALPFFLCFWMEVLNKWKFKYVQIIPVLFIVFFSIQTFKAAKYYENEIIFYTKSLEADPYNLPIVFNLADSYFKANQPEVAITVTGRIIAMAQEKPELKESKYFPYIIRLHGSLVKIVLGKP